MNMKKWMNLFHTNNKWTYIRIYSYYNHINENHIYSSHTDKFRILENEYLQVLKMHLQVLFRMLLKITVISMIILILYSLQATNEHTNVKKWMNSFYRSNKCIHMNAFVLHIYSIPFLSILTRVHIWRSTRGIWKFHT